MSERDKADAMHDVISKLCAISDFIYFINTPNFTMYKLTPNGIGLIIGECISTLQCIGGIHDKSED